LILTGARLGVILTLKWEHVDFERGMLLLPDSKTGKKAIVLNAPALDVVSNLPRAGSYVIVGNRGAAQCRARSCLFSVNESSEAADHESIRRRRVNHRRRADRMDALFAVPYSL
jgi:integrase